MNIKNVIFMLSLVLSSAWAGEPKWFAAPELAQTPDLSQGLRDPAWSKALKIPFATMESGEDNGKYTCESYWLYANGSLCAGFKCVHPESPRLWGKPDMPRDANPYNYECVELYLGDMEGNWFYQLIVDANGNIFDANCRNGGAGWNGEWKSVAERHDGFWTLVVELQAPLLEPVWKPGTFLTFNAGRSIFNSDGTGALKTGISPPVFRGPDDKLFLGKISAVELGGKAAKAIGNFKTEFAGTTFTQKTTAKLASLDAFAADCGKAGEVSLERYRELYGRYVQLGRELARLRQDIALNVIFGEEKVRP